MEGGRDITGETEMLLLPQSDLPYYCILFTTLLAVQLYTVLIYQENREVL